MNKTISLRLAAVLGTGIAVMAPVLAQQTGAESRSRMSAFVQACGADARSHCASVQRGGGRIIACLKAHAGDLSPACRTMLARAAGNRP
jgi:methyl coenzyme M reductase subunit C-like uncharacterized protein (methanogenesis marker protein 7)